MSTNEEGKQRIYNILVYGIDREGLSIPKKGSDLRNYKLSFEPFTTNKRFNDFDGVILFQGIFEDVKIENGLVESYANVRCYQDQLDKRKKEVQLLLENDGFVCFILCHPFFDQYKQQHFAGTDLAKFHLNYTHFHRKNFDSRIALIRSKRSEFTKFLNLFGAASTYFENYNNSISWRIIAEFKGKVVGMILGEREFFVPGLVPDNDPIRIEEYFTSLAEALTSTLNKLVSEVPEWADMFHFEEELELKEKKNTLLKEAEKVGEQLGAFQEFKKVLLFDADLLVDAVISLFLNGFGFKIDATDEYKEDLKILNPEGKPIIFGEIKGTNAGVKREHINQADSHRERAGLPSNFPVTLIINTHIKNSRNLKEKDQTIASEQIQHAHKNNILILRTLDLLRLLRLKMSGKISSEEFLTLIQNNSGWLRVADENWEIIQL